VLCRMRKAFPVGGGKTVFALQRGIPHDRGEHGKEIPGREKKKGGDVPPVMTKKKGKKIFSGKGKSVRRKPSWKAGDPAYRLRKGGAAGEKLILFLPENPSG